MSQRQACHVGATAVKRHAQAPCIRLRLNSVMPPAAPASSARALAAILPLIEAEQPYEAHQKARTFASIYHKSGQYDAAIDVLFQSARELLKTGQQGSGTDLVTFLVDVYESKGEIVSDESRGGQVATREVT